MDTERKKEAMFFTAISANKFETVIAGDVYIIEASREIEGDSFRLRAEYVESETGDAATIARVYREFDDAHGWE